MLSALRLDSQAVDSQAAPGFGLEAGLAERAAKTAEADNAAASSRRVNLFMNLV